jgi:hypothetical protein
VRIAAEEMDAGLVLIVDEGLDGIHAPTPLGPSGPVPDPAAHPEGAGA